MHKLETIDQGSKDKKPASERRKAASRANGAKSKGPITPEGKAASSLNAVKHGCLSALITLTRTDEEIFDSVHNQYVLRFEPRDQIEHDIVEQIVYYNFQMRQAWIQTASLQRLQMEQDRVKGEFPGAGERDRRALAFTASLEKSRAITLLERYARSYAMQAERAVKLLAELQKRRLPPLEQAALPNERNEPSSEIGHFPEPPSQPETPSESAPAAHAMPQMRNKSTRPVFAYAVDRPESPQTSAPPKFATAGTGFFSEFEYRS